METFGVTALQRNLKPPPGQKVFTIEHANRTLPLVSRIMADVVELDRKVCAYEEHHQPHSSELPQDEIDALREEYLESLDRLADLRDELSAIGCQLKDWRRGLVDFLTIHNGRLVELCWRLGEEQINHWHEVGAGYPGRQFITSEFCEQAHASHVGR